MIIVRFLLLLGLLMDAGYNAWIKGDYAHAAFAIGLAILLKQTERREGNDAKKL